MPDHDLEDAHAELTLQEKASLVIGADFWHAAAVDRLDVPRILLSDGPHGLRTQPEGEPSDQLGLGNSAPATCFPTAAALASSWDPALIGEVGRALAQEARALGVSVILGPGVNMKRSPLCGRNFEYFSEDPYLAGELALALVAGTQAGGVGTSLKHFAANNQETDRFRTSAEVDERTLREIYLPAFERVVTGAKPWTVMCAYNKINGTFASEHHWLLTELLRDEWGFEGLVMSDWGAVHDRVAALRAGLDLEMPPALGRHDAAVVSAVQAGELAEAVLDESVRRVLRLVDQARPLLGQPRPDLDADAHHAMARRAATRSAVLLKNEDGLLPLTRTTGTIAVIGEFARTPRYQGAGSSQVNATRVDVPFDELLSALPEGVELTFATGFGIEGSEDDAALLAEARQEAAAADTVVLFLGLPGAAESEGYDRTDMELPDNQLAVLHAAAEVNDRVVVVLANGSAVRVSGWVDRVGAVLECWLGGQAAGGAVADLLTGAVNPSGKLAETIPLRLEGNPSYLNFPGDSQRVRYGEGLFIGYRGYDVAEQDVSYPFGFGLSYTTFALGPPQVQVSGSVGAGDLEVAVTVPVTNTGDRTGAEVVQLYVHDVAASVTRPVRELKGFSRVELSPGETGEVTLRLDERAFAFWSVGLGRWVVEAGEFELAVGTSSRDLPGAARISLDAPSIALPLTGESTLLEWIADPRGREALAEQCGDLLSDQQTQSLMGGMSVSSLADYGMVRGLNHDVLDGLTSKINHS